MKVLFPLIFFLACTHYALAQDGEGSEEEACQSDPVKDEEAVVAAKEADLKRAFVTVTTETVDDALKRTDAYWDAQEVAVFKRISGLIKGVNEAAEKRPPAEWIEACHKTAEPFRFACRALSDPALVDLCLVASAGATLERCDYASPTLEPVCRWARGGGPARCDAAKGEAKALCERTRSQVTKGDEVCSAEGFDAAQCFASRVLEGFQSGAERCEALDEGVEPIAAHLVTRACRAAVTQSPDACPNPTDNHRQSAYVEVLVRSRSGVPWVVVTGGSTGSALCAVDVVLSDDGLEDSRRVLLDLSGKGRHVDAEASGFRGASGALRVRLGGVAHPMRATVSARSVCVPVPTWDGPGDS